MPKITMTQVKIAATAIAGTIVALSAAEAAGTIDIVPAKAMHVLTQVAVAFGIFGASPLGRLIFKDAATNDIVPKALRAGMPFLKARGIPEWDPDEAYVDGAIVTYRGQTYMAHGQCRDICPEGSAVWAPFPASETEPTKP